MSVATETSTATLLIESADQLDVRPLTTDTTIGRDRRCAVLIDHPTVSRTHARIYRDGTGWHFQDLGSQNGSMLGDARTRTTTAQLMEGAELRIGRVRAWFFAKAVPSGWAPPDAPRLAGKLIRCTCGNIGWAPNTTEQHLHCADCGREFTRREPSAGIRPAIATKTGTAAAVTADCAACHTAMAGGETSHACADCGATMHADCWRENRGCATYGCPQVGALNEAEPAAQPEVSVSVERNFDESITRRTPLLSNATRQSLLAVTVFAAAGLPMFGVPPIGYAAYQLVADDARREGANRFVWSALSFAGGVIGFAASARWWLGIHW